MLNNNNKSKKKTGTSKNSQAYDLTIYQKMTQKTRNTVCSYDCYQANSGLSHCQLFKKKKEVWNTSFIFMEASFVL